MKEKLSAAATGWYVYLIRNRYGQLYCGATTDVIRRFREHRDSGKKAARALRGKGPLELEFSCLVGNRSQALTVEYRIKRLSKPAKERLVLSGRLPEPLQSLTASGDEQGDSK